MINFSLPYFYENKNFYQKFFRFCRNNAEKLNYHSISFSSYGSFPFSIWHGGKNSNYGFFPLYPNYEQILNTTNTIRLDCSNVFLDEMDLYDRHQNAILNIAQQFKHHQLEISNLLLYNYIEEKYPNNTFSYILSQQATDLIQITPEIVNAFIENDKFLLINLSEDMCKDLSVISDLKKIEVNLLNPCAHCLKQIQQKCRHDESINQLLFSGKSIYQNCFQLLNYDDVLLKSTHQDIHYWNDRGITHFKIIDPAFNQLESFNKFIIKLFIKPDYINDYYQWDGGII